MSKVSKLALAAWLVGGCATMGLGGEPFKHSSLDHNRGQAHRQELPRVAVQQVVGRVIALGKQRDLALVKQTRCDAAGCELALRGKPIDRRIFRGTTSQTKSYYSRYFVTIRRHGDGVTISAVGVPVLGGRMACPASLKKTIGCRLERIYPAGRLVAAVREQWGYDISGANEAETLTGMLAELRRAPAGEQPGERKMGGRLTRARRGIVVAVFEIEDQAGVVKRATLRQLTEYLAAQVTQRAGYQVIPRDQLRSRLSAEKRKSYRDCYEQRCQIALGKAVAAEKSLATKLLRVGRSCALTSMLYDLQSETTERAASAKTACDADALLAGVEQLAKQL